MPSLARMQKRASLVNGFAMPKVAPVALQKGYLEDNIEELKAKQRELEFIVVNLKKEVKSLKEALKAVQAKLVRVEDGARYLLS